MNKVFVLKPGEDWIVDRLVEDWYSDNSDISVDDPAQSDVVWLLSEWCYRKIDRNILRQKKVLTTIHHIVPEKFGQTDLLEFLDRDSLTSVYHVPNYHTKKFIESLTRKPIHIIPYWANQKIWKKTSTKSKLRDLYNLPSDAYIVGSFQRDTEGRDLKSPKLEKGPDLLADYLVHLHSQMSNLHVLLSGWRRQYVIDRLKQARIPYTYFERPSQQTINDLYQTLDLYPVSARVEGGPQSLIECGLLEIPVVSRDIGISRQVLPVDAINDNLTLAKAATPNVSQLILPHGYKSFRELIREM